MLSRPSSQQARSFMKIEHLDRIVELVVSPAYSCEKRRVVKRAVAGEEHERRHIDGGS